MTEDGIRKEAEKFFDEHFRPLIKKFETECPICTAINCINNERCINCNAVIDKQSTPD